MKVIVFCLPDCQPCRMTKERFAANGIEFVEGSIEKHRELFRNLGFKSAPVVLVEPDTG
ncbi:glutaredoxin family protein, partial [Escherichia coli]